MAGYTQLVSDMPLLFYLLRGIRRTQGSLYQRPRRQPITISQLAAIISFLERSPYHSQDRSMLRSAVTLAFFGLLRCSEYTSHSMTRFDPESTLCFQDIRLTTDHQVMHIYIKKSKTDPFRAGCTIRIGAVGTHLCPVEAMHQYTRHQSNRDGPLFVFVNGSLLTRLHIKNLLSQSLPAATNIDTHSFRIGGATAAASAGVPNSTIQILGRWSSDAYRRYLHLSDDLVQRANRGMATAEFHRMWDSDNSCSVFINI